MALDDLAREQQATGGEIQRLASNYNKDSKSRKTEEYLHEKIRQLETLWKKFDSTDSNIRSKYSSQLEHPYFQKDFYELIQKIYEKMLTDLNQRLEDPEVQLQQMASGAAPSKQLELPSLVHHSPSTGTIPKVKKADVEAHANNKTIANLIQKQRMACESIQRGITKLLSDPETHPQHYYQIKMKTLETHWEAIQKLHYKIWDLLDTPSAGVYNMEEYFAMEDDIQNLLIQLHEKATMQTRPQQLNQTNQFSSTPNPAMHLPKVVLPKFDGDYLKWRQFRDLFTELVHNQPIPSCQKMWYLKTSITGEAEKLIRHYTTSDANYDAAWRVVNDRYENSRLLVTALLNKLLAQPTAHSENASAIRSIHDTTQECLISLENLGISTLNWDPLVLHILLKKLDRNTHMLWEQSLSRPKLLPSLEEFLSFLEIRFHSLETLGPKPRLSEEHHHPKQRQGKVLSTIASSGPMCICCKGEHQLFTCERFLQMSPNQRLNLVQQAKHCVNCLKANHNSKNCPSRGCTRCQKRHNTLLHLHIASKEPQPSPKAHLPGHPKATQATSSSLLMTTCPAGPPNSESPEDQCISLTTNSPSGNRTKALLGTVILRLHDDKGSLIECRAILDCGSQLNLITEKLVQKLGIQAALDAMGIEGVARNKLKSGSRVNLKLQSRINGFTTRIEAYVLPDITSPQPARPIDTAAWNIPQNIALADPQFHKPGPIDLLIGAGRFYSLLAVGQIPLGDNLPVLQNTVFGWIVSGDLTSDADGDNIASCGIISENESLNHQIEKFWRLEEAESQSNNHTAAERRCETYFIQTTTRDANGRFTVELPISGDPSTLGESKELALARFKSLERKLNKNADTRKQYLDFMQEYVRLGHMEEINVNNIQTPHYFLPHHCVIKPDSTTTKLRVVFDASAKTSTNISLNELLYTGPTIQDDVFTILLRFRLPRFVFTADIEKMYRQIQMDQGSRQYQLIWWRDNPSEILKCYQLCTVTYGTTCAPYLATRCLKMLAEEEADTYPLGAEILQRDFYVDDVLTGSDSLPAAIAMQIQLRALLQSGGFRLRKWCANHPRLLQDILPSDQEVKLDFNNHDDQNVKTMGLIWLPKTDSFCVKITCIERRQITKRTASSDIAHIFDPLGILAPVVVSAKLFLQKMWSLKLDWDAALPQDLHTAWSKFREDLRLLEEIRFPRHVFSHKTPKNVQLHIFADASERAYGAAAYVRSVDKDNIVHVRLLCAKSKVAPMKQITLPRLELCAAKVASELCQRLKDNLRFKKDVIFLWTDSTAVLGWINSDSSNFHTFVANRISAIQQVTIPQQWRHVKSDDNPADLLSRGLSPAKLANNNFWFYGPIFLHGSETRWPEPYIKLHDCTLERREKIRTVLAVRHSDKLMESIDHRNSFRRLQRIIAYLHRFVNNTRPHIKPKCSSITPSVLELDDALTSIVKQMQREHFADEIKNLTRCGEAPKGSDISSLTPFVDNRGMLRVGGRLEASALDYDAKHPILLPHAHLFTKLLLNDLHMENLHAGPQALLAIARQKFWPVKGKSITRSVVQHCVRCAKAKPKLFKQLMGSLPADRVQPARPFVNSGVDFCGPVWTHFTQRGKHPKKAYIAVFCCFATKAVHLEIVSDLSTDGFLGALKRFMARRGLCSKIYCDNATNFVGASNRFNELQTIIENDRSKEKIMAECNRKGVEFHFIPPKAPHFGGLWEAAVKSAKHLIQRTIASAKLTYEEMETIVIEAEAVMNSRPLTPLSADPNDLTVLTPAHLLIGEPLTAAVDPHAKALNTSLSARWNIITRLKNEFWQRWIKEYLNHLQYRHKWKSQCQNAQPGTMVIIKEENTPPMKWPLGRIIRVIKGTDDLVRVADVQTSTTILRRPIHNLAPLPIEHHPTEQSEPTQDSPHSASEPAGKTDISNNDRNTSAEPATSDAKPRKRARISVGSAIVSLLITCIVLPFANSAPVKSTPFDNNPGLYFENLGAANVITSEWNLVAYYDMRPYWTEFEMLLNSTSTLEKTCERLHDHQPCLRIMSQIKRAVIELQQGNQLLQVPARIKRGALNFIGNIANSLFGVLDSEYADEMASTIDNLRQNEEHLAVLARNQTSILDATVNVMKRNQEDIVKEFHEIETHYNQISIQLNSVKEDLHQEQLSQLFSTLVIQVLLLVSNFQRVQYSILDVLTDTHHGKVNTLLISPDQFKRELLAIKGRLPSSLKLPLTEIDILRFYRMVTIEGRATANHIIFRLRLPILASEEFELFKLIPVPTKIHETFAAIRPSYPFLIVNLHRDQYYPLSEQALHNCISITPDRHLCKQTQPMYRKGSSVSACEINLMNHSPRSSLCQVVKTETGPHWIQLHNSNQWIYSLEEATTINIVCEGKLTQLLLEHTGILSIQDNCVIKQPLVTIQGHNIYPTIARASYLPSANLTNFVTAEQLTPALRHTNEYNPHLADLQAIKQRLLDIHPELPAKLRPHDVHHYSLGYICLVSVSVIAAYLPWKKFHRCQTQPPTITISTGESGAAKESSEDLSEVEVAKVFDI